MRNTAPYWGSIKRTRRRKKNYRGIKNALESSRNGFILQKKIWLSAILTDSSKFSAAIAMRRLGLGGNFVNLWRIWKGKNNPLSSKLGNLTKILLVFWTMILSFSNPKTFLFGNPKIFLWEFFEVREKFLAFLVKNYLVLRSFSAFVEENILTLKIK